MARQSLFPPSLNTAVFVDRKNYRLQDIQLSKIGRGKYRPRQTLVPEGAFPRTPLARSLVGPLRPTPLAHPESTYVSDPETFRRSLSLARLEPLTRRSRRTLKLSSPQLSDSHEISALRTRWPA